MNELIKNLRNEIKNLEYKKQSKENELKREYFKIFDDSGAIKELVSKLEQGEDITREEFYPHWPCSYVRLMNFDHEKTGYSWQFLKEYLEENYCIHVNNEDCPYGFFSLGHGPGIIIQNDGSIWDQEKDEIIFNEKDFESEKELFQAIEDYMENQGYFPGVYRSDYCGDIVEQVNTSKVVDDE